MQVILALALIIAVSTYICGPIVDPDLWWHITVGRWILHHGEIPIVDYWNMFGAGKPWRAYSWTNEILFAWVDATWGISGLYTLKLALAGLLGVSLFFCLGKLARDWFFGAILAAWTVLSCFNHFTLRPQSLIWIFFVWLILVIQRIEDEGPSVKRLSAICLIMILWANTHLTAALGILTIVFWLYNARGKSKLLPTFAAGFLGTLLTPYWGGEWLTFFAKTGHPLSHQSIAEFQPATLLQYSTAFLVVSIVFLLSLLHFRPKGLEVGKLFWAGGFVLAGLGVVKFLPLGMIALAALTALLWARETDKPMLGHQAEAVQKLRQLVLKVPKEGLAFVFLCLGVVNVYHGYRAPLSFEITPVEAVDFMQAKNLPHPILNDFGRGGYMMYRYSDGAGNLENRVPIDGRTNVVPPEVYKKFQAALRGKDNWSEYLELVKPETILWPTDSPLSSILLASSKWCRVFKSGQDRGYLVLIKRELAHARKDEFTDLLCG